MRLSGAVQHMHNKIHDTDSKKNANVWYSNLIKYWLKSESWDVCGMYWMNHCHLCSLPRDLRQEDYVFTSVCLFVCQKDCRKTNDQIFVKFCGMIVHNPGTRRLDFDWPSANVNVTRGQNCGREDRHCPAFVFATSASLVEVWALRSVILVWKMYHTACKTAVLAKLSK